jgi:hypothetical protein
MYTTKELANKTKIPKSTLIALRMQGGGPRFFKTSKGRSGKVLYDWRDVMVYLEENKYISTSDVETSKTA